MHSVIHPLVYLSAFSPCLQHLCVLDHWVYGTLSPNWNKRRDCSPFGDSPNRLGDLQTVFSSFFQPLCSVLLDSIHALSLTTPQLKLLFFLKQTQVQRFKKGVSNSATQDSIMNAHNKTKFTHAKINCTLKDSSCESPISKNLLFTILASNASSSSTTVFKCPRKKNDFIFIQWSLI
ncbi:hypothetical protein H5410_045786 [Solanum commersonii]|uniref:Uncharacterized protein n=1 Tax=Solanum commersonii TaxID=4109 RepID=A0A9J5XEP1_SOLCO|nr:hypothetical protein H5410_045786 [Solanum commersonii]